MRYILIFLSFLSCSSIKQNHSNLNNLKTELGPCPSSPNCVSTTASKKDKQMTPLLIKSNLQNSMNQLDSIIQTFPRVNLISKSDTYLHYTFKTKLGSFTDDVEFLADSTTNQIHFRSASRVGWSDAGANKRRMKRISKAWQKF